MDKALLVMVLFLVGALPVLALIGVMLLRRGSSGLRVVIPTIVLGALAGAFAASWIDGEPNIGLFVLLFFPVIPVGGAAILLAYVGRRRPLL